MSHTAKIAGITISNIDALRAAVEELNESGIKCKLLDDVKPRAFYENQPGMGKADHVLQLENSRYDIGFYHQPDGTYEVRTDFWGNDIEKNLGVRATDPTKVDQARLGKLFQTYGLCAATMEATQRGYSVRRVEGENGRKQLIVTGFA